MSEKNELIKLIMQEMNSKEVNGKYVFNLIKAVNLVNYKLKMDLDIAGFIKKIREFKYSDGVKIELDYKSKCFCFKIRPQFFNTEIMQKLAE